MNRPIVDFVRRFPLTCTLAAMIAWLLHFLAVYGGVGLACARGFGNGWIMPWLVLTTALALAASGAVMLLGAAVVRGRAGRPAGARRRFLGRVALWLGVLAGISIVYTVIPALWIPPCR